MARKHRERNRGITPRPGTVPPTPGRRTALAAVTVPPGHTANGARAGEERREPLAASNGRADSTLHDETFREISERLLEKNADAYRRLA